MKIHIITLLTVCFFSVKSQVTNYAITNSMGLANFPHKIYNSNDGNLLLSNGELNVDAGYSHILKVKPSGDTIFIKSSDSPDLFVTSTGNIITNAKYFDIVTYSYSTSYLTLYDRNYNKKWQLDIKENAHYDPANINFDFKKGFNVSSIFEINSNHFRLFANASVGGIAGITYKKLFFDFDSMGNILSPLYLGILPTSYDFINQAKNKTLGFYANYIRYYNLSSNSCKNFLYNVSTDSVVFKTGLFIGEKIYVAGLILSQSNLYKKAVIASIDTSANVNWCKVIIPNDSTVTNEFSDIINVNGKLLCKYRSDTSTYVLSIDTLGQLLSSYTTDNAITNYVKLANNVYTSRAKNQSSQTYLSLLRTDTVGNYLCATPTSFLLNSFSLTGSLSNESLQVIGPVSHTLTNQLGSISSYTVNLSDGCDIVTEINKKNIQENIFMIYPNPSNGIFEINTFNEEKYTLQITNSIGQAIQVISLQKGKTTLDLSHEKEGIYFYSVLDDNEVIKNDKIVIIK